jgi:hypothetical protein
MVKKPAKRLSLRNKLVKVWDRDLLYHDYSKALGKKQNGRGIYVLYEENNTVPYYIGKSKSSLRGRIRRHATKDRHKGLWHHFSYYQIRRTKYIDDIERLLLHYYKPIGNRQGGRFRKKYKANNRIKK